MPKVSIIVPCWGAENYLDRCVHCLVNQTLHDIEIILIDDQSPDKTPEMCDEWARKSSMGETINGNSLPPIRVVHKINGGLGFARNTGIEMAQGEYVAFLDCDDTVELNAYEVLYKKAKETNSDVVFGWNYKETKDGYWINCCRCSEEIVYKGTEIVDFLLDMVSFPPGNKSSGERVIDVSACMALYRNSILQNEGVRFMSEREIGSEDLVYNVDFLMHSDTVLITPFVFYYYYHSNGSLSTTFKPQKFVSFKRLREALIARLYRLDPQNFRTDRVFIGYAKAHLTSLVLSARKDKNQLIKGIVEDDIWKLISKTYRPSYLPLYSALYYKLILLQSTLGIRAYARLFHGVKRILHKR